jgi:hypothetical protein
MTDHTTASIPVAVSIAAYPLSKYKATTRVMAESETVSILQMSVTVTCARWLVTGGEIEQQ